MLAAGLRGNPDFLHRRLTVDDDAAVVLEHDFQHRIRFALEIDVGIGGVQRGLDAGQGSRDVLLEFSLGHALRYAKIFSQEPAMKTAPLIAALALTILCSGCGTKGPLYLPKKGDTPVKTAPLPDPVYPPVPAPETTTEKSG